MRAAERLAFIAGVAALLLVALGVWAAALADALIRLWFLGILGGGV